MSIKQVREQERQEAIERLRGWIKPGDTVYTILRHVSSSGMTRHVGVVLMPSYDHGILHPISAVSKALGLKVNKNCDGVILGGCGMDMGFHLVYELGYVLYPEYPCLGENCPSNFHFNSPNGKEAIHKGGYALRHQWL